MNQPTILLRTAHSESTLHFENVVCGSENLTIHGFDEVLLNETELSQNQRYTVQCFISWSHAYNHSLVFPELSRYAVYLMSNGRLDSTVTQYLNVLKSAYRTIYSNRELLRDRIKLQNSTMSKDSVIDEVVRRIQHAVGTSVIVAPHQNIKTTPADKHIRLSPHQAKTLLYAPDLRTKPGIRDAAMIALALCTGVREAELVTLQYSDLREIYKGEAALLVRNGKGSKTRLVPYGMFVWCLEYVDRWCNLADVKTGYIFRRVYAHSSEPRHEVVSGDEHLNPKSFIHILAKYPLHIQSRRVKVRPHDLRRTYALRCFESEMELDMIRQNMGHENLTDTFRYIGYEAVTTQNRRIAPLIPMMNQTV